MSDLPVTTVTSTSMLEASETILNRACCMWQSSMKKFRDARIEMGKMLAAYLDARLREAVALSNGERLRLRCTRSFAIKTAAERLEVPNRIIDEWLRIHALLTVMTVDGTAGDFFYTCLTRLQYLVTRPAGKSERKRLAEGLTVLGKEVWAAKGDPAECQEVFDRAVKEKWSADRCRQEVKKYLVKINWQSKGGKGGRPRVRDVSSPNPELRNYPSAADHDMTEKRTETDCLKQIIRVASTKEAATMLGKIVGESSEPLALAREILRQVEMESRISLSID